MLNNIQRDYAKTKDTKSQKMPPQTTNQSSAPHPLIAKGNVQVEDVDWWLNQILENNVFDMMVEAIQPAVKVGSRMSYSGKAKGSENIDKEIATVVRMIVSDPEQQRHFAEFTVANAANWALMQLEKDLAENDLQSVDAISERLRSIWTSDEFLSNTLVRCFSIYTHELASILAMEFIRRTSLQ